MIRLDRPLGAAALALAVCAAPLAAPAAPPGCPPGLAKKTPPCVPPGLARQGLRVGEVLPRHSFHRIDRPWRYGLPRDGHFVVLEGLVLRLDPDTRAILTIIGAAAELLD
jgi:hypothetical protein